MKVKQKLDYIYVISKEIMQCQKNRMMSSSNDTVTLYLDVIAV